MQDWLCFQPNWIICTGTHRLSHTQTRAPSPTPTAASPPLVVSSPCVHKARLKSNDSPPLSRPHSFHWNSRGFIVLPHFDQLLQSAHSLHTLCTLTSHPSPHPAPLKPRPFLLSPWADIVQYFLFIFLWGVQSLCWAEDGGRGGRGGAGRQRSAPRSVVFQSLVEEEVGCQVLVLLAGEVGLDDQGLGEAQRF